METLATSLKLAPLAWQEGGKVSFLVNPQSAGMAVAGQPLGFLGKVNPSLLKDYDIKNVQAWYAQLWLEIMPGLLPTAVFFKEFSRYPSIQRDLSLLIPLACRYQDMLSLIQVLAGEKLRSIALIDTYQGEQIPSGFKCYTISLGLQEETRTLTDEEVDTFIKNLLAALKEKSGISIRETGPAGLLSKR
jgi:phenylalanyl-tRNA synthetase beta chain